MPVIFYQSNFCPECGNKATPRRWWQHRYFCEHCAQNLGRRWDWLPFAFLFCGLLVGLLAAQNRREVIREVTANPPLPAPFNQSVLPLVSAQDASAQLKPVEFSQPAITYQCGARTQRGTACKHRVAVQGERCFQHQGQRSILK